MTVTDPGGDREQPRRAKGARLEARISREQKALFQRAAAIQGRSLTDFVVASVHDAAMRTLQDYETLKLGVRDSGALVATLLEDAEPGKRLKAAARRYRDRSQR
jgi:uncharacterized protein (DUF1778 family)